MTIASEMSRPIVAAEVAAEGLLVAFEATPAERESLAAVNDVESVERLAASLHVRPHGRDGLLVQGTLDGEATRICVVTLEPFSERVREEIDMRFAPEGQGAASDDPPDALVDGALDLWAIVAEHFTLGLDAHPRKPGASFETVEIRDEAGSPFAALRALDTRRDKPK